MSCLSFSLTKIPAARLLRLHKKTSLVINLNPIILSSVFSTTTRTAAAASSAFALSSICKSSCCYSRRPPETCVHCCAMSTLATAASSFSPFIKQTNKTLGPLNHSNSHHLSSLPVDYDDDHHDHDDKDDDQEKCLDKAKHCETCTCDDATNANHEDVALLNDSVVQQCALGREQRSEPFPPPLSEPKFTFLRRVLNDEFTIALDSMHGKQRFLRALQNDTAESYFAVSAHFSNQSEPAYCGVTTLLVVLNALAMDPAVRWKGGWRYFGSEDVLLQQCCLDPERVRRVGINLAQFAQLASCQGLQVQLKRPPQQQQPMPTTTQPLDTDSPTTSLPFYYSLDDFRNDVIRVLSPSTLSLSINNNRHRHLESLLVVSYARSGLGQTGNAGHFSPVVAYDAETDTCLVLDVARFKYPPFWVQVDDLYRAMQFVDSTTQQPRGWLVIKPPRRGKFYQGSHVTKEAKIPAQYIPAIGEAPRCPLHQVKVEYCPNNNYNEQQDKHNKE